MPRNAAEHAPEPGDDAAIEEYIQSARDARRDFRPAPQPEPGEQPNPPKGTPPADAGPSDDEIARTRYRAVTDVGLFQPGNDVRDGHWSPSRVRRLLAEGKIEPAGQKEAKADAR